MESSLIILTIAISVIAYIYTTKKICKMMMVVMISDKMGVRLTDEEIIGYLKGFEIARLDFEKVDEVKQLPNKLFEEFNFQAKRKQLASSTTLNKEEKVENFLKLIREFNEFVETNTPEEFLIYQSVIDSQVDALINSNFSDFFEDLRNYKKTIKKTKIIELDEAIEFFGLTPPILMDDIKKKYQKLAKKYHPDLGCKDEDAMKNLNNYYDLLKQHYQ